MMIRDKDCLAKRSLLRAEWVLQSQLRSRSGVSVFYVAWIRLAGETWAFLQLGLG
jgi:hypothetical protein